MAVTETRLYGPAQPGTVTGVLYTVPGATDAVVKQIVVANTTASAATITLGINGSTAALAILFEVDVEPNETYTLDTSIPLSAAETINGLQGTGSALTVTISGYEVTP